MFDFVFDPILRKLETVLYRLDRVRTRLDRFEEKLDVLISIVQSPEISEEDQRKLNRIYDVATEVSDKLDEATRP